MEIDVEDSEIHVAYRLGQLKKPGKVSSSEKPRNMLIRATFPLKERIFENIKNIKDKTNDKGEKFYINKQLPELWIEKNRLAREKMKQIKEQIAHLPVNERPKLEIKDKTVLQDGVPIKEHLPCVKTQEMFPEDREIAKMDKINLIPANPRSEKGSEFLAYAAKVDNIVEVRRAYIKLKRLYPSADHISAAYKYHNLTGYQDDGEVGAGHKLLRVINENDSANNLAVFVVRFFGNFHLGPDRFGLICDTANNAIVNCVGK